ncbi:glycosyltransferase [Haloarcula brevis]|uniref:glycosyltransferase n=1 Tax=Haloarcula brevis TaxID=3111453 RepID=UPI00300E8433
MSSAPGKNWRSTEERDDDESALATAATLFRVALVPMTVPLQVALAIRDLVFALTILPILTVWLVVNAYLYYPVCLALLKRHWRTVRRGWQRRVRRTDSTVASESAYSVSVGAGAHESLADESLPTMAVLLPAYEESAVIEQSIRSVQASNYPPSKLQLYVLTEPGDDETSEVLAPLSERYDFVNLVVPAGYPNEPTKPRALNYGFEHSDEELVCVIDAEDIVDPELFRTAAAEILVGDVDYAQAKLDMINEDDGWLNTMFRADYAYWFRSVLPAFADAGYPMPLGGTSNFFRRSTLTEMHDRRLAEYGDRWTEPDWEWVRTHGLAGLRPWDPQNVTEDFELGLFLWKEGKTFSYIDLVTREESPLTLDGWIKQRTRWKKGKLYTYLQYRATPPEQPRARFHLFLQSMLPHTGPINIAGIVITLMLANFAGYGPGSLLTAGTFVGLGFVLFAMWLHARGYWSVSEKPPRVRLQRAIKTALTLPFYWLLQWGADIRAIYQTYYGDFDGWERTEHFGRNNQSEPDGGIPRGRRLMPDESATRSTTLVNEIWVVPVLSTIVLVAMATRLFDITAWSLSGSEIHWLNRASGPLWGALISPADPHPPLYALTLRGWVTAFGTGDVAVRGLSVLFALVTILALFVLTRKLYDNATALVAAGLFSVGITQIHLARTVGPATMAACLTALSWLYFYRLGTRRRVGIVYVLATVALVYTHFAGIAVVLAQWLYTGLSESPLNAGSRRIRRPLMASTAMALPWCVVALRPWYGEATLTGSLAYGWLTTLSLTQIRTTLLTLVGHPDVYPLLAGNIITWVVASAVATIFAITSVFAVFTFRDDGGFQFVLVDETQAATLSSLLFMSLAVPFGVSILDPSVFVAQFTALAAIPLYILVARGLTNLDQRHVQTGLVVSLLLASAVFGAFYADSSSQENWRSPAQQVALSADGGDILVFQPGAAEAGFRHYYDGPDIETVSVARGSALNESQVRYVRARIRGHDRVWLLRYRAAESGPLLRVLQDARGDTSVSRYGVVELYEFRASSS